MVEDSRDRSLFFPFFFCGSEISVLERCEQSHPPRLKMDTSGCCASQHLHDPVTNFFKRSFTHTQTHNRAHIVTLALLNLATVLSRCNKCLRAEAWEVFPQIRDAASVSDYLSAVMELCSLRLSRSLFFLLPLPATGDHHSLFFSVYLVIFFLVASGTAHPSDAFLFFAQIMRQLRPLKAPDLKVPNDTTKLDFRLGMCRHQYFCRDSDRKSFSLRRGV